MYVDETDLWKNFFVINYLILGFYVLYHLLKFLSSI